LALAFWEGVEKLANGRRERLSYARLLCAEVP
jgi:hypothetical protein